MAAAVQTSSSSDATPSADNAANSNQYLCPEPSASTAEADKSPLAMLTATCNNIGMPDGGKKDKASPRDSKHERKENRPASGANGLSALNGRCVFPNMPYGGLVPPYMPGMMPNPFMPSPYSFMPPRACTDPGCKGVGCLPPGMPPPPDLATMALMSSYSSLFSALTPPTFSMAPFPPPPAALQALAAASAVSTSERTSASTSATSSTTTTTSSTTNTTTDDSSKYVCGWMKEGQGKCGREFDSETALFAHVRTHTANTPEKAPQKSGGKSSPASRSSSSASSRFQPYAKTSNQVPMMLPASQASMMAAYLQAMAAGLPPTKQ